MTQLGSYVKNIDLNKNKTYSLDTIMQRTKIYWDDTKHPRTTFQCKQCKKSFTRIQVLHETFQLICNKYKFQKTIKGYINQHILWLLEGYWPQYELCHDIPSSKEAMAKHISHQTKRNSVVSNVEMHLNRNKFLTSIQELLLGKSHTHILV